MTAPQSRAARAIRKHRFMAKEMSLRSAGMPEESLFASPEMLDCPMMHA